MGEDLSENKQLVEDITKRFEETQLISKADTQKRQSDIENEKKEAQETRKKAMERLVRWKWKMENVRCKTKVTLGIKTW